MMLTEVLLREVPPLLVAGLQSGELSLFGSVIRNAATGRIAGFLQETAGLDRATEFILSQGGETAGKLAGAALKTGFSPVNAAINVAGFATTGIQNEQIKAAVATVQSLQVANLALGAAGIGVSIAGFAVLAHKIGRVEAKVDAMGETLERIARGVEALRLEPIRQDFDRLKATTQLMDEGWHLADPTSDWRACARDAGGLVVSFERRVEQLLDEEGSDVATADSFLEALALAIATRVSARLAAGDDVAGREAAADGARTLARLGGRIKLGEAALARVGSAIAGTLEWKQQLESATDALRPMVAAVRGREAAAASTAATVEELARREMSGRAWLEAARGETEQPLLCLLAADTGGVTRA